MIKSELSSTFISSLRAEIFIHDQSYTDFVQALLETTLDTTVDVYKFKAKIKQRSSNELKSNE